MVEFPGINNANPGFKWRGSLTPKSDHADLQPCKAHQAMSLSGKTPAPLRLGDRHRVCNEGNAANDALLVNQVFP